jgi:pimeloyl-ACP methyl ester carboxylesterase
MRYVLIPGAGGAGIYWRRVRAELEARGHRAVAPDLPAGDDTAGFDEYANVVRSAADELSGAEPPTLVAQSMGAFTALLVAERMPVREVLFVNAMIPRVGETAGEWWDNTGQTDARRRNDAREGRDPEAGFDVDVYFMHDLPPAERAVLRQSEPAQSETPFSQPYRLKKWPDVPMRVISATGDRFFPIEFQRRVARERLGIDPIEIPGGHLVALSQPVALADLVVQA